MSDSPVIADLAVWGPASPQPAPSLDIAERYCRQLATSHYENFPVVSWLLPRGLHQHFYNVYAFCRWADDLGDETGDREKSLQLLAWWKQELDRCYRGEADHPVFVALLPTIRKFGIPQTPFADLISAFVQDQSVTRYDSWGQLLDYCQRSANPVGRLVLFLCGRWNDENAAWSDSICTGLQLANFWQDVSRDFDIGRVYLPGDLRQLHGYCDDDLEQRRTTPQFLNLMEDVVTRAKGFLKQGEPLVAELPGRVKLEVKLFVRGGQLILREIEKIDYRVWDERPILRKRDFAWAALKCLLPGG